MYGASRFFDDNFLKSNLMTVSSVNYGVLSGGQKDGTGAAQLVITGQFSGADSLVYTIQVHDITGGQEVGAAKYRWRTSETPDGQWEATDITTHSTAALLNYGVYIRFVTGTGDDFEQDDAWTFRAIATWKIGNALDANRATAHQSATLEDPNTYTVDFLESKTVTVLAIHDHNLAANYNLVDVDGNQLVDVEGNDLVTDTGSITLKANTSAAFGSPAYSSDVPITENLIVFYLSQSYQHWQLEIQDYGTPLGVIEFTGLYLGDYFELDGNADWDSSEELDFFLQGDRSRQGLLEQQVFAEQTRLNLILNTRANADVDTLKTFIRALYLPSTGKASPFYFHFFNDVLGTFTLMRLILPMRRTFTSPYLDATALQLEEEPKSRF